MGWADACGLHSSSADKRGIRHFLPAEDVLGQCRKQILFISVILFSN